MKLTPNPDIEKETVLRACHCEVASTVAISLKKTGVVSLACLPQAGNENFLNRDLARIPSFMDAIGSGWSPPRNLEKRIIGRRIIRR